MTQMADDLKDTVKANPDCDLARFPCTAQRILGIDKDEIDKRGAMQS
jgi:hypothetical protein